MAEEKTKTRSDYKDLFEMLFDAKKEVLKLFAKPGVKRGIKRRHASAWDDAAGKIVAAEAKIFELQQNVAEIDLNGILTQKQLIRTCKELQADIEEDYEEFFSKKMEVTTEDDD